MYQHDTRSVHIDQHNAAISICAMDDGRVAITAYSVLRNGARSNLWMYTFGVADAEMLLGALHNGGTAFDYSGGSITVMPGESSFVVVAYNIRNYCFSVESIVCMRVALGAVIDVAKKVPEQHDMSKATMRRSWIGHPKYIGEGI